MHSCKHCCSKKVIKVTYFVCVCVFKLSYLAYNAHVSYCHLRPAPLYSPIPHHFTNGKIFEKELLNSKCVF
jgi:hypothetical protein